MAITKAIFHKLYRNTGTYGSPTWNEIPLVGDVTVTYEFDEDDTTTRRDNGFKTSLPTLAAVSIEAEMPWDPADADLAAILTAFQARSTLDLIALDGAQNVTGSQGPRMVCCCHKMPRSEKKGEAAKVSLMFKPAPQDNVPSWYTAS